uniref:Retrotransposon gag domain-containing protein n=1 Tax=Anopheles farauti TaxID=69004 RepID=A0A182Q6P6_9DIPT
MAKQQTPTVASILPEFHGETDDWNVYREILDEFYRANGISGDDRVPVLISVIGKATYGTLRSLCHPAAPRSMRYEDLCTVLARQYIPEIAIFRHRAQFYRAEQQRGESVKEWYARLKALSIECKFEEALLEPLLIDRFVVGLVAGPVRNRLYEERPDQLRSIEKAVDLAATKESELRQANEGEAMAHEFACLAIGDEMRHGRRHARMHGKHLHRFGRPSKEERHGPRRHHGRHHGRHHHHRHHPSDYESEAEHHHHPFHAFGHHHGGPVRHFGPPAFGPGPWGGHHRRELAAHQFGPWGMGGRMGRPGGGHGCPAMMEGFGRPGRSCGKWRKRHHHRRSSSTSSSSSSSSSGSSTSSSSSSSSGSSDSEAPNEQTTVAVETQRMCRKLRRGIEGKHQGKQRHSGKRHGHGRHHHNHHKHHNHHRDHSHGKGGRRNRKHQQEEPIVSQPPERATPPTDPTTDPELIE